MSAHKRLGKRNTKKKFEGKEKIRRNRKRGKGRQGEGTKEEGEGRGRGKKLVGKKRLQSLVGGRLEEVVYRPRSSAGP